MNACAAPPPDAPSARAEPVARRAERSVPMRLQHLQHRLLNEAVEDRRNAERANAARPAWESRPVSPAAARRCRQAVVRGSSASGPSDARGKASTVMPSIPGAPLLRCTRANAFLRLSRSTIASMHGPARPPGFRLRRFAASASVPPARTLRASPVAPSPKASSSWIFCRLANARAPPYSPFQPFGPSAEYAGLLCPLLTSAPRSRALRRAQSGIPDTDTDLPR